MNKTRVQRLLRELDDSGDLEELLWLLHEEQQELGETDLELELVHRELVLAIADGHPIHGAAAWEEDESDYDIGDLYE